MDCSLPGFSVYGILQARILEWVATPFSGASSWLGDRTQVSCVAGRYFTILCSGPGGSGLVAKLCLTLVTPWTVTCQTLLSMGFSRQEYWSGLSFPPPGDLPNMGIRSGSSALKAGCLPTELQGKLCIAGSYFTVCALAVLLCKNSWFHVILITNTISKLLYKWGNYSSEFGSHC